MIAVIIVDLLSRLYRPPLFIKHDEESLVIVDIFIQHPDQDVFVLLSQLRLVQYCLWLLLVRCLLQF